MERKHFLGAAVTTAAFWISGMIAVSAQTVTITNTAGTTPPVLSGGLYTYSYDYTASFVANFADFNFSDPNVTFLSASGPLQLSSSPSGGGNGFFTFDSGALPANAVETFTFQSSDYSGGTVGAGGVNFSGSGVAATNPSSTSVLAPLPAPEPSAAISLSVLAACLAFGVILRKHKSVS